MSLSIHSRIILSALIVLILFMGLTGFVLDKAFINNIEHSQRENLQTQIYTLLATAELDDNSILQLPEEVAEPRLNIYESTLHARILTVANNIIWQSKSMSNIQLPLPTKIKMGEFTFSKKMKNEDIYALINFTTIWVTDKGEYAYVFQVAENSKVLNKKIMLFRKNLWSWLVGVSLILITFQTLILRWGLKPLRYIAEDLANIENGAATKLSGNYPKEITPLTNNLNQLLNSSQQKLTRYRDALGNMAHSIKTPIAVLKGIINSSTSNDKDIATEQLSTINNIVEYQLQRAATVGRLQTTKKTGLLNIANKTINGLQKVYLEKNIEVEVNILNDVTIKMDEGDLYELLGNLLENAFKWSKHKIIISAEILSNKVKITIEDDGPGINEDEIKNILLRGHRADQNTPGHGLGLAMVNDILLMYEGSMEISKSGINGAKIIIEI